MYLTQDQALNLSDKTLELFQHQRKILNSQILRYRVLIDASPQGRDCHLAAATLRLINQKHETRELQQYLQELRNLADQLLKELP